MLITDLSCRFSSAFLFTASSRERNLVFVAMLKEVAFETATSLEKENLRTSTRVFERTLSQNVKFIKALAPVVRKNSSQKR
jgi:hypothetical protein